VFIGEVVEAARVQSIIQRKAYGRRDAIDDAVVSYVVAGWCILVAGDGDGDGGARGVETGGVICGGVGGGSRTLLG